MHIRSFHNMDKAWGRCARGLLPSRCWLCGVSIYCLLNRNKGKKGSVHRISPLTENVQQNWTARNMKWLMLANKVRWYMKERILQIFGSCYHPSKVSENLFLMLERGLDVVLCRPNLLNQTIILGRLGAAVSIAPRICTNIVYSSFLIFDNWYCKISLVSSGCHLIFWFAF